MGPDEDRTGAASGVARVDETAVVIGGGATAVAAVLGLRTGGFQGPVALLCGEPHLPYDWLSLVEQHLGAVPGDPRSLHPLDAGQYAELGVEVVTGAVVTELDPHARRLTLSDGRTSGYSRAILATGSVPTPLGVPGEEAGRRAGFVHDLSSLDAALRLRAALGHGGRVVVVGEGRGASAAVTAARSWGAHVQLVLSGTALLPDRFGVEGGVVLADLHRDNGVDVLADTVVAEVLPGVGVRTRAGDLLPADLVVTAGPAQPVVQLAESAGVQVRTGVVVGTDYATSVPGLWAAGSVAETPAYADGEPLRVDGWSNTADQGLAAGVAAAGGSTPLPPLPYYVMQPYGSDIRFWGDLGGGYDEVVFRGEDEGEDDESLEEFCAFWLRRGRVVGVMAVDSEEPEPGRLVAAGAMVSPARLADLSTPLEAFV